MPSLLIVLFLAVHAALLLLRGGLALWGSFACLVAAPLLALLICAWRALAGAKQAGWLAVAVAMLLWAGGMLVTAYQRLALANEDGTAALSMLLFVLYGVPLTFVLASPEHEPWYLRLIDAALACLLGYLFFVHTYAFASARGTDAEGLESLRLMFDLENVFIALFAGLRYLASRSTIQRDFFGTLGLFALLYLLVAGYINHFQVDVDYGEAPDLLIDLPFLLLAGLAWHGQRVAARAADPPPWLVWAMRAGSPLMVPVTLLLVSMLILSRHPRLAVLGFVTASLGYGLRSVLSQVEGLRERARLDALARVDALTGLANRRSFDEALGRAWQRARREGTPLALLLLDIDHFKLLNDGLGHPVGDQRLREVAAALRPCLNRPDDLLARYGGEEFVAILPATTMAQAMMLAERLRLAVEQQQLATPAPAGRVTVSIGVGAATLVVTPDPALLVATADMALYDAKQAGRNRVGQREVPLPQAVVAGQLAKWSKGAD